MILNVQAILGELVSFATPSSASNLKLLRWVESFIQSCGWHVELMRWVDDAGVEKANLVARPAACSRRGPIDLAFICHTDTVPYSPGWHDALVLLSRDGQLHGLGACDVKGSLACLLAAAARTAGVDLGNVALILTADEEIGCKGMDRLLASTRLQIGAAIVSEPTSLRMGVAGKGYGLARITVRGREAHSAFPQQGISAISIAARLIARIEDALAARLVDTPNEILSGSEIFDPPVTTINIGEIEGGTAKNIIAGQCNFLVEWRSLPGEDPAGILKGLQVLCEQVESSNPGSKIELAALRAEAGFAPDGFGSASSGDTRLQARLTGLLRTEITGISFGSEASRASKIAAEVIVIGPGDMLTAHSERECVPVDELEIWTDTLVSLMTIG